ncbi:MAG: HAD-IB family hydrolase [Gammaproteobacteria bacterium]|uniref:HAD-IB family hydrolase n=1 Tax=Pseudomaricurvus alcaniphilus TaxID=1166482 RepID=UPI00140D89A6|nr:HAD-IB family hydrolase [Pseudomaricurvus alcaniphilus]MBR9909517.1 HAD-IB family hydrolase [Gammaproteobacteria bacterium]NHN37069.1 HAD-IB family hydrolase [Pseudomaricurvus alcaniphilus]
MSQPTPLNAALTEIKSGPQGPQVGVFFDLDGTVIAGFSVSHLAKDRIKNKELGLTELGQTLAVALSASVGNSEFEDLLEIGARTWQGRSDQELHAMGERLFQSKIVNIIYPEMQKIVRAHQQAGHTVVLSSSATAYQVEPVARFLGIDKIICNRFSVSNGILTGAVEKPVIWGKTKALAAQEFTRQAGIDLQQCYFYADGDEDTALMYLVGKPRPTNPRKKLARIAAARGWPIQRFSSRQLNNSLTTAAGVASILPIGLLGAGLGLLKRNKRAGLNFAAPLWMEALLRINGVKLNVIGRDNLWKSRPAVFIFNHRNNFDGLMMARLVATDFSIVGKKELQQNWLTGTIGRLADVVFIDRSDAKGSVAALQALEELGRKGLSVSISPEGTRHDTETVGPFKKGAFRIAMSAGMPIVPVVIRNAEMVAARDSKVLSPGIVDVAILPPIDTRDWTLNRLYEHIADVRQLYIDTLQNWPTEEQLAS